MFQTEVVEKIETDIVCSITGVSPKIVTFLDNVDKYCRDGQATYDMAHAHFMLDTLG
jgi:hypothetical protein